jgi:hypothetical protein
MYNEKIENLVNFALADGELTEKEKQILFKKAEEAGIDLDEFEMVLDAKLHEKQQKNMKLETPVSAAPKSDKFGDVKKCPSCGAMIQSFSTKCSDCGHDFRNIDNANSIKEFFRDYQKIEDSVQVKENLSMGSLVDDIFGSSRHDDSEDRRKLAVFTKKKEFIMHFPIPNSKEDLLEFLTMAVPLATPAKKSKFSGLKKFSANFGEKNYDYKVAEVWMQKCEQILMKSRLSMNDDKKTLEQVEYYGQQLGIE